MGAQRDYEKIIDAIPAANFYGLTAFARGLRQLADAMEHSWSVNPFIPDQIDRTRNAFMMDEDWILFWSAGTAAKYANWPQVERLALSACDALKDLQTRMGKRAIVEAIDKVGADLNKDSFSIFGGHNAMKCSSDKNTVNNGICIWDTEADPQGECCIFCEKDAHGVLNEKTWGVTRKTSISNTTKNSPPPRIPLGGK